MLALMVMLLAPTHSMDSCLHIHDILSYYNIMSYEQFLQSNLNLAT